MNIEDINVNPSAFVERNGYYTPDTTAVIYGDRGYSYGELTAIVRQWAQYLTERGVGKGDRVAYLGLNSRSFVHTMLAAWRIGAVFMPLNFRLAPREVAELLERGAPRVLVAEPCHQQVVEQLPRGADLTLLLVDDDEQVPVTAEPRPGWERTSTDLPATVEAPSAVVTCSMNDLAILMFTSGTTGQPKGVQLSFGNIWWNSSNVDTMVDTRPGDVNLCSAPLFHIGALNSFAIRALVRGNTNLIHRTFDPRKVLGDIEKYQVASAFLVPAQLSAMRKQEEFADADLSSLRAAICAGAPVPPILIRAYLEKGVPVQQAWGLTETSPFATYLPTAKTEQKTGSCGIPMPYCEVKLIDPATLEDITEPGISGEMCVRGPNVTEGYWQNPAANQASFLDGWFRSGDIGYVDEDGYFFIVDRLKDMIITGGENVYPAEVERVLEEFPGVQDAAVVGIPHQKWGETVVAVMQFATDTRPSLEEVREFCAGYLARYKLPHELIIANEVPRNSAGKLNKRSIRELVAQRLSVQEA